MTAPIRPELLNALRVAPDATRTQGKPVRREMTIGPLDPTAGVVEDHPDTWGSAINDMVNPVEWGRDASPLLRKTLRDLKNRQGGKVVGDAAMLAMALPAMPKIGKIGKAQKLTRSGEIVAHHGNGKSEIIPNFDSDFINTGQGAQAYGYGHYFAQEPNVAEDYWKDLSAHQYRMLDKDGNVIPRTPFGSPENDVYENYYRLARTGKKHRTPALTFLKSARDRAARLAEPATSPAVAEALGIPYDEFYDQRYVRQKEYADELLRKKAHVRPNGRLYTVALDVDPERMIDWDAGIADQPQALKDILGDNLTTDDYVLNDGTPLSQAGMWDLSAMRLRNALRATNGDLKKALSIAGDNERVADNIAGAMRSRDFTNLRRERVTKAGRGEDLYREMQMERNIDGERGDKLASADLARRGVHGIQYWDAGSRDAATAASNGALTSRAENALRQIAKIDERIARNAQVTPINEDPRLIESFTRQLRGDREMWLRDIKDAEKIAKQAEKATRNFVIFDDNRIRILKALGLLGAAGGGADALSQEPQPE